MSASPKVSCICITRNRRMFLRQAVQYFARASYCYRGPSELVIVDGSEKSTTIDHLVGTDDTYMGHLEQKNFLYSHQPSHVLQAGVSHNVACELATGDIIIQWDDDDWQSTFRIRNQVELLLTAPGDAFAFTSKYYWYHLQKGEACKARSWDGEGSTGATFAYWKDTWKKTPFEDVPLGEDIPFFSALKARGCPMLDAADPGLLVYVRHNQNGSAMTNYVWNEADTCAARAIIRPDDLDFYDGIGEILPVANWNHPNAPGSKMHVMTPLQQQWARHFR